MRPGLVAFIVLFVAIAVLVCPGRPAEAAAPEDDVVVYEADFRDGQAHGWKPAHNLAPFTFDRGFLSTQALGEDAFMMVSGLQIPTSRVSHVIFRMRSDHLGATQVYFSTTDSPDPAAHPVPQVSCRGDSQWHEYEVRLAGLKGFTGILTMLRLDPVNGGNGAAKIDFAWIRLVLKAPRLMVSDLSCSAATLEPGEKARLKLRITNHGGPLRHPLSLRLAASPQLEVSDMSRTVTFARGQSVAEVSWGFTARRLGLGLLQVIVSPPGSAAMRAEAVVPVVVDPRQAGVKPAAGCALSNGHLRLTLLRSSGGATAAAVLGVKTREGWKNVAVLEPLAELAYATRDREIWRQVSFSKLEVQGSTATLTSRGPEATVLLRFDLPAGSQGLHVRAKVYAARRIGLRRFSGPIVRVGLGSEGASKQGAVFPGLEMLGKNEPSSNTRVVGETAGYRPRPPAHEVTVPVLAVEKDGVLTGLMWDPLQAGKTEGDGRPVAEFASPNFLDGQSNHRLGCFVPDGPGRGRNEAVTEQPHELAQGKYLMLETQVFAVPGAKTTDAVPLWYSAFGMPRAAPPPTPPQKALGLCIQGWAQTLWFPDKHGFNNHWHIGQSPYWDGGLAANILVYARRTGEDRWARAVGIKPDTRVIDLTGSLFKGLRVPPRPAALKTQRPDGLWPYEPSPQTIERCKKFTRGKRQYLGKPGSLNVGVSAKKALALLNYAERWSDEQCLRAGLKALDAMLRFEVPRGCQEWEVPIDAPDLYAAAQLVECYRMGYELTGQERYLRRAIYWAYTGLPFLYAYEVPGTGPGATVHIPWPKSVLRPASAVFRNPDAHHPTPWASIPVFGTSFYRVVWFGNVVHWCGLVWAKSVYALLEEVDDPILRAAADGVVISGIHQTFDKEPYVGLLPDTWHLESNFIHPAFIGPVRLEDALRFMIRRPAYGRTRTRIARFGNRRAHVTTRAWLTALRLRAGELRWQEEYPRGEICETLVVFPDRPSAVLVNGRRLPQVEHLTAAKEGWALLPAVKGFGVRVRHESEKVNVEVQF